MIQHKGLSSVIEAVLKANSFEQYIRACRGLFPVEAVDALRKSGHPRAIELLNGMRKMKSRAGDISDGASFVFSAWDFTDETTDFIMSKVPFESRKSLALGCPNFVRRACERSEQTFVLIDLDHSRNFSFSNTSFIQYDIHLLTGSEVSGVFDSVILDPPWYQQAFLHWINVGAKAVKVDGLMVFPLFGEMTRPSASAERELILDVCSKLGFVVEIVPNGARYMVPSFEAEILRRAGLPVFSWKVSDLVFAKKVVEGGELNVGGNLVATRRFPCARIALRDCFIDVLFDRFESGPLVSAPEEGDQMRSPSARDAGNMKCNVFSSNGLRMITSRPSELCATAAGLTQHSFSEVFSLLS